MLPPFSSPALLRKTRPQKRHLTTWTSQTEGSPDERTDPVQRLPEPFSALAYEALCCFDAAHGNRHHRHNPETFRATPTKTKVPVLSQPHDRDDSLFPGSRDRGLVPWRPSGTNILLDLHGVGESDGDDRLAGFIRRHVLLLFLCFSMGAAPAADKPMLRFIVGEDWASPYLELQGGRPVGGLAFELMEAIARAADARPSYLMLPAKRTQTALHAGDADLMCMMNSKWLAKPIAADRIGPEMVLLEDVLATAAGARDIQPLSLPAQQGLRVGTVLGYRYPELNPLFADGRLVRDDAPTQQGVLEKLARGRTKVAIVDRLVLAHYNRSRSANEALLVGQVVSQTVTHCLLGGRTQLTTDQLHRALRAVVERGELGRLMERYR